MEIAANLLPRLPPEVVAGLKRVEEAIATGVDKQRVFGWHLLEVAEGRVNDAAAVEALLGANVAWGVMFPLMGSIAPVIYGSLPRR